MQKHPTSKWLVNSLIDVTAHSFSTWSFYWVLFLHLPPMHSSYRPSRTLFKSIIWKLRYLLYLCYLVLVSVLSSSFEFLLLLYLNNSDQEIIWLEAWPLLPCCGHRWHFIFTGLSCDYSKHINLLPWVGLLTWLNLQLQARGRMTQPQCHPS